MKTICISIAMVAILLAHPVFGQADAAALETSLHGKPLGLRNYSADQVVKYTWFDGKLVPGPVDLHGIRAFFADTVRQKGGKILIEGQGETLVRVGPKLAPMGKLPMRLEIDLQGEDAASVLPKLQAAIFFPSLQAALQSLPDSVSDMLPFSSDGKFQSTCHCIHVFENGKWIKLEENDPKLTPPGVVKEAENPGLDQKAIDSKVSGSLTLVFSISETGGVDEVWIAKPLGAGLDEMAAKSLRESLFRPGRLDGKPVGTVLIRTISVN
jgi:hypothetical protein